MISKKRAGRLALLKKCVDPVFPKSSDLVLIVGVTLLVRAGLLPRLGPPDFNLAAGLSRTGNRSFSACHHFQQRLFKIRAICEMNGVAPPRVAFYSKPNGYVSKTAYAPHIWAMGSGADAWGVFANCPDYGRFK
jgi:hypothetical protein